MSKQDDMWQRMALGLFETARQSGIDDPRAYGSATALLEALRSPERANDENVQYWIEMAERTPKAFADVFQLMVSDSFK